MLEIQISNIEVELFWGHRGGVPWLKEDVRNLVLRDRVSCCLVRSLVKICPEVCRYCFFSSSWFCYFGEILSDALRRMLLRHPSPLIDVLFCLSALVLSFSFPFHRSVTRFQTRSIVVWENLQFFAGNLFVFKIWFCLFVNVCNCNG